MRKSTARKHALVYTLLAICSLPVTTLAMQININSLPISKITKIDVDPDDTIAAVKSIYGEKKGLPADQLRLYPHGKTTELTDDQKLDALKINAGDTLDVKLKLRAG